MLDMADGTGGRVPLEDQRKEHVEMLQLLGDPAMRLPLLPATVKLTGPAQAAPGGTLLIGGEIPAGLSGTVLQITLERPPGETAPGASHTAANDPVIQRQSLSLQGTTFTGVPLSVPAGFSGEVLIVRAVAGDSAAGGLLRVKVQRP
jgi:hypothetical protein